MRINIIKYKPYTNNNIYCYIIKEIEYSHWFNKKGIYEFSTNNKNMYFKSEIQKISNLTKEEIEYANMLFNLEN